MEAGALLDDEFFEYWEKLGEDEKESLLTVAKNYVRFKGEVNDSNEGRRKLVHQEREKYLRGEGGSSYTWEEVKAMAINCGRNKTR